MAILVFGDRGSEVAAEQESLLYPGGHDNGQALCDQVPIAFANEGPPSEVNLLAADGAKPPGAPAAFGRVVTLPTAEVPKITIEIDCSPDDGRVAALIQAARSVYDANAVVTAARWQVILVNDHLS